MKHSLSALCATALAVGCCAGELRPCALNVLPVGAVRPEGWLRMQLELQRDGITGHAEELYDDIGNSDWLTGARRGKQYAWERGPYYAKGLVSLAFALDDDALKAKARRWVDCILASQRPDGDFGPKARNWWANMISLWLLRDWADATGDVRVAPFLARYFDYQRTAFKELPIGKESCWAMARAADELDVVYWLYARTGESRWLEFAHEVSAQTADWTSYYREGGDPSFPHGYRCHIVNFMQGLKAPALQWRLDGDPRKAGAYEAAFAPDGWVMRTCGRPDRMVNGSEPLTDRSASEGTELCAIAERILSCQSVISVFGSAAVADDLETVAYNALPGTLAPDGKGIRYYCLLNQPACVDKLLLFANNGDRKEMVGAICPGPHAGFGCCRSNFHLAWPKFAQTMWMGTPDGGLAAVAYGPCRVSANGFEIEEGGDYPFGGNVTLTVRGGSGRKPLALRIPAWATGAEVKVNGVVEAGVKAGTFHRVTRDWRAGDVVTLAFPLKVCASFWRHDAVAVSRGPLLYALKMDMEDSIVDRYKVPYENEWIEKGGKLGFPRHELKPVSPWGYALVRGADGAFACEASPVALGAANPFRPGCAPVTLRMKVVPSEFGGWGHMREGAAARAIDPPPSPVPATMAQPATVELVPFGSTQIRISLFPWTQARSVLRACADGPGVQLVRNGGFEDVKGGKTVDWNAVGRKYVYVDGAGRSGTRALAFENDDPKFYSFPGQQIDLKPGKTYKYEVWVRTENLKGDESGASICIEWNGPDGKWLGGSYTSGVKGTKDWTRIEGVTQPIPANARGFRVSPYVRKGMTGKVWFDDISVTPYVRAPVMGLYSSAYRNLAASGPVTFKAALCLDAEEHPISVTRGVLRYTGADGARHEAAMTISKDEGVVTLDVAQFALGAQNVSFALVKGGKELGTATCKFTRVEKMPARAVWFDGFGRTIVKGEPFFPLGMYWGGITTNKFEIYAKGPFNCLMPYASPTSKDLMDLCHAHGVKVIYSVKDVFSGTHWAPKGVNTEADEVAYITARVSKFKDHPALLAWYLNDELPLSMLPRLSARRDLMERLDPGHPGWVVLYQFSQIADYMPSFDVIGTDPYPIPRPAAMASTWTRATRKGTMGLKPLWQVPQAFDWAAYKKTPEEKKKNRAPTEAELRSMCWQCIACGANGLVMYSWFDLWKEPNGVPFAQRWAEVYRVGQEIKEQIPVLLATGPAPSVSGAPEELAVRTWGKDGAAYVLVVNTTGEPRTASLTLSEPFAAAQRVFGPEPKLVGAALGLALAPLEPALVRLTR